MWDGRTAHPTNGVGWKLSQLLNFDLFHLDIAVAVFSTSYFRGYLFAHRLIGIGGTVSPVLDGFRSFRVAMIVEFIRLTGADDSECRCGGRGVARGCGLLLIVAGRVDQPAGPTLGERQRRYHRQACTHGKESSHISRPFRFETGRSRRA